MSDVVPAVHSIPAAPDDRQRPRYHPVSPSNWMNDPNGVIQKNGVYHLFYQYNPNNPRSETKHWGHMRSTDLVHWEHLPVALAPMPGTPDEAGVWSGCAVDQGDHVLAMYTGVAFDAEGVEHQLPCIATSTDDDLIGWTHYEGNPVIRDLPDDLGIQYFRDHTIWRDGDTWYMGVCTSLEGKGGAVLAFRSDDHYHWDYLHPLATGRIDPNDELWGGIGWECPDFFFKGDTPVLIVSGWGGQPHNVVWFTGPYANQRLEIVNRGLVDHGPSFYAPQSFTDEQGRRVMFGWFMERRPESAQVEAGWSGAMSLPRLLSVTADGTVESAPAPENDALRVRQIAVDVSDDGRTSLTGDTIELIARFRLSGSDPVGLRLRESPDGSEVTMLTVTGGEVVLDTTHASSNPDPRGARSVLAIAPAAEVQLRVYLDRSVIEVAVDDRQWLSDRVYPTSEDAVGVSVIAPASLLSLDAWDMGNAFPDA